MEWKHSFRWHCSEEGRYVWGQDGYFIMEGKSKGGDTPEYCCRRFLTRPVSGDKISIELGVRFVLGKKYEISLLDSRGTPAVICRITADGWIRFQGEVDFVDSLSFLTWFRGRPCVDPDFIPGTTDPSVGKSLESDEMCLQFKDFDLSGGSFSFEAGGQGAHLVEGCLKSEVRDIAGIEFSASRADVPGNRIRLRYLRTADSKGAADDETFPIHWRAVPSITTGYPDDNTRGAAIRPVEGRWLECTGRYCWVKARLPMKLLRGEIVFCFRTPDISKESCLELHEHNGAMADSTWPIKIGINKGRFFSGFASQVNSTILNRPFWKSQQAIYNELSPQPDEVYEVRIKWSDRGTYRWWVNGTPMRFSGKAKTGRRFDFPELEVPGYDIPFTNSRVYPPFGGVDTLALHYGTVTHAHHTVCYGNFTVRPGDD